MRKFFLILLLACLMIPAAHAQEERTEYRVNMLQMDAATYQVHCEVDFTNPSEAPMTGVMFTLYANQLRRETSLVAENGMLEAMFPGGYAPGGVEFGNVTVNGEAADWGMQGENELFLRVGCDLQPGERATFGFDYYLLIIGSRGDLGFAEKDIRLSGFLPTVALWEADEFIVNPASAVARYAVYEPADYSVELTVSDKYTVASAGVQQKGEAAQGMRTWRIEAPGVREFALAMSAEYREQTVTSAMGTQVRLLGWDKSGVKRAAETAEAAIDLLETWFGKAPYAQITLAQAELVTDGAAYGGLILIPQERYAGKQKIALEHDVVAGLAQQYFGMAAGNDPAQAPWLSVSVPEMLYYQYIEAREGYDNMLGQLNEDCLSALVMTLPGGYSVDSPLAAFYDSADFEIVVRHRGAAALYQIREGMGTENFLAGLREFYEVYNGRIAGLQEFVSAFNAVSDRAWDMLIVDWFYTIDEYQGTTTSFFQ